MALVPAASGEGRPIPQPRPVVETFTGRCGGERGGPSTPVQQECGPQKEFKGESSLVGTVPQYFFLKPKLLKAFSLVGAVSKPLTFREVLCFLKDYLYKYNLIDSKDSRVVNCGNTELGAAFEVDRFEYDEVKSLLFKNIFRLPIISASPFELLPVASSSQSVLENGSDRKLKLNFSIPFPEVPNYQSGTESEYSYQGYETALCHDSDTEVGEEEGEEEEYELVTETEVENDDQSDSESDVKSCLLILDVESGGADLDEDFFADESESESSSNCDETEGNSTEDEKDHWVCPICSSTENRPYMGCCLKCFNLRKDWYPDPPKNRRKRKPRPKKDRRRGRKSMTDATTSKDDVREVAEEEDLPSLQRTTSSTSTSTQASTISTYSLTSTSASSSSSQDSGFGSQDLSSFEVCVRGRKRDLSDTEEEEEAVERKKKKTTAAALEKEEEEEEEGAESEEVSGLAKTKISSSSPTDTTLKRGSLVIPDTKRPVNFARPGSENEPAEAEQFCNLCCTRPKNASLIHGSISHIGFCYPCAKKLYNSKAKCPICRRKIHMITKNVYV